MSTPSRCAERAACGACGTASLHSPSCGVGRCTERAVCGASSLLACLTAARAASPPAPRDRARYDEMAPEIRRGAPPHRLGSLARQPGARGPRAGRARLWRRGGGGGHTALARRAARARASKGEIPQDQPRSHLTYASLACAPMAQRRAGPDAWPAQVQVAVPRNAPPSVCHHATCCRAVCRRPPRSFPRPMARAFSPLARANQVAQGPTGNQRGR